MSLKFKKGISMLLIFVIVFIHTGQTLEAMATTVTARGLFGNSIIEFSGYFEKDGTQSSESSSNVDEKAKLTLEVSPQDVGNGFIKEGVIQASTIDDSDINFKFSKITDIKDIENDVQENENGESDTLKNTVSNEVTNSALNNSISNDVANSISNNITSNEVSNNILNNTTSNEVTNNISTTNSKLENNIEVDKQDVQNNNDKKDIEEEDSNSDDKEEADSEEAYEQFVNEEEVIEDILNEEDDEDDILSEHQIEITSDNEIAIKNIINKTIIEVEIEYSKEDIDTSNLSQEIELTLNGKYIDLELNETDINISNNIVVNWIYEEEQNEVVSDEQEVKVENGDSISYTMTTDDKPISKGRINANYNSEDVVYETEFTSNVNLNIVTTTSYEEISINATKENYLDAKETAFETDDVYYKKVKFNQEDIKAILENGGSIEIMDNFGNLLHTVDSADNNEITLNNPKGVYVLFRNINISKNVSIEFTKAIGKSSYDKASFNTVRGIQSTTKVVAKHADEENIIELPEASVRKMMNSSSTVANLSLNNNSFKTANINENVELKITLNNETENSDLYVNPSFEIVFPEYVKDVKVQNINITYADGLRIKDFHTYMEDGYVKMKINLVGIQSQFSNSKLTHGTNILVTTTIKADEEAPSKKDQIKMYYYNEGVTNYTSQTKWTISEDIPSGILRETNGFDATIINYATPSGLVTANSIINYDGNLGEIKSIKQGNRVARIERETNAKIATMQLYVANNTEEKAENVALIGRIPFTDNKNVITGEELGTTVDTRMLSRIREKSNSNENSMVIYYSYNGDATSDLSDSNNGWTESPDMLTNIKSYMIVIDGVLNPESILKFEYDFEIPEKLDYNAAIYGSFGAYYNNNELSIADNVGLQTEISIPITMELTSDIADNVGVGEGRFINYTLKVTSNTSDTLYNIDITNNLPQGTTFYDKSADTTRGDNGLVETNATGKTWTIDELKPNDTYVQEYAVKVNPEMAGKTISNTAFATMDDMSQKSNTVELKVFANSLDIEISKSVEDAIDIGGTVNYHVSVTNISGKTEKNVKLVYQNPKELQVDRIILEEEEEIQYQKNEDTRENTYIIPELAPGETKNFTIIQTAKEANNTGVTSQIRFELEDGTIQKSSEVNFKIENNNLQVSQTTNIDLNTIEVGSEIEFTLNITNNGDFDVYDLEIKNDLSEFLEPTNILVVKDGSSYSIPYESNEINLSEIIDSKESTKVTVKATVKDDTVGQVINNRWNVTVPNMDDLSTDTILITIVNPGETEDIAGEGTNTGIYSISGTTWVDVNENGNKDAEDIEGIQAEVQLLKDGEVVQTVNTNEAGEYSFTNLEVGEYIVVTNYEKDMYETTSYESDYTKKDNSNAYEVEKGKAITDSINITNSNVENLNIGLVEKDRFDFEISQNIVKATVISNGKEKEYEYYDLDLAKIELKSKQLKNAIIRLEYKIRVTNIGNVAGKASKLVNYMPKGMTFDKQNNPFWEKDDSGNLYYSGLKDTVISAGDFQDVILILDKQLNKDDNIGIINSKTGIATTESDVKIIESKSNNFTSQQTIITKAPSRIGLKVGIPLVIVVGIGTYVYMVYAGIIDYKELKKRRMKR